VQAGDLSNAVAILPETADETIDNQTAMLNLLAKPDEVDVGGDLLGLTVQAKQGAHFLFGEHRTCFQAPHQGLKGCALAFVHDIGSGRKRGERREFTVIDAKGAVRSNPEIASVFEGAGVPAKLLAAREA
jgi:hypothetical protein